jgi:subtilisin family serine protease
MYLLDSKGGRIGLEFIGEASVPALATRNTAVRLNDAAFGGRAVDAAVRGIFELRTERLPRAAWRRAAEPPKSPPPAVFRERDSGLVRMVHREVIVRFRPGLSAERREQLLAGQGLELRRENALVPDQVVTVDRRREGPEMVEMCNGFVEADDIVFATPNFVSEYRRGALPEPMPEQWHLLNRGLVAAQVAGEDVNAVLAWPQAGDAQVVVAVLDDGVDIDHPNLVDRIWTNPDSAGPDVNGRDFFLPDEHPDHFNPRPKQFVFPFDQMTGNDIHGTPCAGVIGAAGRGAMGIARNVRILPVKIFHADSLAQDERVADAIRYAALNADILSCSWSGPRSTDIELAIEDAGRLGRGGRGAAVFCASGNEDSPVGYPAALPTAIAVGASTDQAVRASYSNFGPELDFVAPSSGGVEGIFTTDVANPPGRGFNVGLEERGGADGLHTNEFGGTSSATPLAAGVGALVLSTNPELSRDELRGVLADTAEKIGDPASYGPDGRSDEYGFGRIDAQAAVAAAR